MSSEDIAVLVAQAYERGVIDHNGVTEVIVLHERGCAMHPKTARAGKDCTCKVDIEVRRPGHRPVILMKDGVRKDVQ